ncbi:MAG: hypothetical protein IPJ32_16660 [Sphingobacteriaceae bacterium]|nr:hypothetical protein [Sphingobacteriaceae bacterium]
MAKEPNQRELIVGLLKKVGHEAGCLQNTIQTFSELRNLCKEVSTDLKSRLDKVDKRVSLSF